MSAFEEEFAEPIRMGGYSNATGLQVATAKSCAETLRMLIAPFLLRRLKRDVTIVGDGPAPGESGDGAGDADGGDSGPGVAAGGVDPSTATGLGTNGVARLPSKTEQVLFCRLTDSQRELYERVLDSDEMAAVLDGRIQSFRMITFLRKICNHSDLVDPPNPGNAQSTQQPALTLEKQLRALRKSDKGGKGGGDDEFDEPSDDESECVGGGGRLVTGNRRPTADVLRPPPQIRRADVGPREPLGQTAGAGDGAAHLARAGPPRAFVLPDSTNAVDRGALARQPAP